MIKINGPYANALENMKFIDLFCGLGGFRLALESFGAKCIFSSDIDKHVCKTYEKNFGEYPEGDITKIDAKDVPKHDILCAGFPCQAFSISGKQKGFEDARGTLFFDIVRIVDYHHPKILLLENVKNLKRHDNGRTFKIIKKTLNELGYNVYDQVISACDFGVPQARERIYIVCIRKDIQSEPFKFPKPLYKTLSMKGLLLNNGEEEECIINKDHVLNTEKISKASPNSKNKPIRIGTVNKGGQGDRIYDPRGVAITLSAEGGGTGAKTGLYYVNNNVRKLHPRECARLMGFPDDYNIISTPSQSKKQFGNSVVIDVLQYIVKELIDEGSVTNG